MTSGVIRFGPRIDIPVYAQMVRNGRNHITLGAAGSNLHGFGIVNTGNYDHVMMIRLEDKPVIKNYLLDGTQLDFDGKDQQGKQFKTKNY